MKPASPHPSAPFYRSLLHRALYQLSLCAGATALLCTAVTLPPSKAHAQHVSKQSQQKGWLGVQMERRNTTDYDGVAVQRSVPGSPADNASLQEGDVIQRVEDQEVKTPSQLSKIVGEKKAGDRIQLHIAGPRKRSVSITLAAPPKDPTNFSAQMIGRVAPSTHAMNFKSGADEDVAPKDDKVRIIEMWATWCAPCRLIQPTLTRQVEAMDDTHFEFVGVAEDDVAEVRKYLARYPANYRIVLDPKGKVSNAYWSTATPTFVLLDASGKIVAHQSGIEDVDALFQKARALVDAAKD